jgi:hypothetical protein
MDAAKPLAEVERDQLMQLLGVRCPHAYKRSRRVQVLPSAAVSSSSCDTPFDYLELGSRGGGARIDPNGQHHGDRVSQTGQVHACALCLECENVVAERHNLRL